MMRRDFLDVEEIPQTHRGMMGTYRGRSERDVPFQLVIEYVNRRVSGNDLMRKQVQALSRGRPLSQSDMYKDELRIWISVGRSHAKDITLNPNGSYSHGRLIARTLQDMVFKVIDEYSPAHVDQSRTSYTPNTLK
jgi:hypothetical protein